MVQLRRSELRAPAHLQKGVASSWTLTLFPSTQSSVSKTSTQDLTRTVGGSNPTRRWLSSLCKPLLMASRDFLLFPMTAVTYLTLFNLSRKGAALPSSHPHRLRHGGAFAEASQEVPSSDLDLATRGGWASLVSVKRYRQPAPYLRQLHLLSRTQIAAAHAAPKEIQALVKRLLKP